MSNPVNYNFIKTQIDIDEFIDYEILHIYLAEKDWPGNNIKFWNSGTKGHEKWRWICYDLDQTFIHTTANSLDEATATNGPSWPNPPWSTFLLRSLLTNARFQKPLYPALCLLFGYYFQTCPSQRVLLKSLRKHSNLRFQGI